MRPKICGIYAITHIETGNFYVGSSVDVRHRWAEHKVDLNSGRHVNPRLLNAWRKYGPSAFSFVLLEEADPLDLRLVEQQYLNLYVGERYCYNIAKSATAPTQGRPVSAETRRKLSDAQRGRKKTPAHIEKVAAHHRGVPKTEETKRKLSEATAARLSSPGARKKLSEDTTRLWGTAEYRKNVTAGHKGRVLSQERKDKIAAALSQPILGVDPETMEIRVRFSSTAEAGRCGYDKSNIMACFSGHRKTHGGLLWFKEDQLANGADLVINQSEYSVEVPESKDKSTTGGTRARKKFKA